MTTFTNFCCRSGGSNLNAGTRTGDTTVPGTTPFKTYASGTWVNATGVFTVASGNPLTDGVAVGDFASVYPDAATVTPFVGCVTARNATTITVSLTAKAGTAPVDGTTNTTLTIGGAWKGPNGSSGFPFGTIQNTLTDASGHLPRVNFMNDATYSITAQMTHNNNGYSAFQGFTTTYGDGGKATFDGGTSGTSYNLLNFGSSIPGAYLVADLIFQNNGASGSADALLIGGNSTFSIVYRCVFNNVRGRAVSMNNHTLALECEAYACNQSNTANIGVFQPADRGTVAFVRCIAHNNPGSNVNGFFTGSTARFIGCIADTNGKYGFVTSGQVFIMMINCDSYNNGSDGLLISDNGNTSGLSAYIENCNFVKNGGWGINTVQTAGDYLTALIVNCAFGTGTQANSSGTTSLPSQTSETGSINYASGVTPWVAPTTGNFSINLGAAIQAGRGAFTETAASYTGTVGYPDIGSAQTRVPRLPMGIEGMM